MGPKFVALLIPSPPPNSWRLKMWTLISLVRCCCFFHRLPFPHRKMQAPSLPGGAQSNHNGGPIYVYFRAHARVSRFLPMDVSTVIDHPHHCLADASSCSTSRYAIKRSIIVLLDLCFQPFHDLSITLLLVGHVPDEHAPPLLYVRLPSSK
jgi:hypothetical protein